MKVFVIKDEGGTSRRFESEKKTIMVGRGSHNDIVIRGDNASRDHGFFRTGSKGLTFSDRSKNGSYVNGALYINKDVSLKVGDTVEISGTKIKFFSEVPISTGRAHAPQARGAAVEPVNLNASAPAPYKSYFGLSFLVLVLYIFLWPVGLILNFIFFFEARKFEGIYGTPPEGKGCLLAMLIWQAAMVVISIILFFIFFLFAGLAIN